MFLGNTWVFEVKGMGLDPPPLRGADRNLMLSPGQKADQHYQALSAFLIIIIKH